MESEIDPTEPETLSRRIDEVCRLFEDASRTGRRPRPEQFLSMVPEAGRQRLLRKLLILDVPADAARWEGETAIDPSIGRPDRDEPPSTVPDDDFLWNLGKSGLAPIGDEDVSTERDVDDCETIAARVSAPRAIPKVPGFKIVEELGRGSMGVVYLAFKIDLARPCALKMILAGEHASEELARRFLTEAQTVARLRHENIVRIYSLGNHDGCPFVELEFVEGGPLSRKLDGTPWQPSRAAKLVRSLALAIDAAHREGVVHRDLKPGNILMGAGESPKIADFGLAKTVDEDSGLTQTGAILGTPSYMAPEQAGGHSREVGPAADIYAMGAILYELLTGRPPFRAASILQTLEQVRTAEPVPPIRLQPGLPKDLDTICLKCLQKDPGHRYASSGALAEDLRRHLDREPIVARPVGQIVRMALWAKRNPRVAGLSVAVGALLLIGTLGAVAASLNIASAMRIGRIRLIGQHLKIGSALVDRGNVAGALPWFVESLRLDEGEADREAIHRVRIASILRGSPRPARTWSPGGPVDRAAYSKDGRFVLVVAGGSGRVWDVKTGAPGSPILAIDGTEPGGSVAAFHPDGRHVLTARGPEARIWEFASGRSIRIRYGDPVTHGAFSNDGRLAVISAGPRTYVVDSATGRSMIPAPMEHPDVVNRASFHPDGERIVTAWGGPQREVGGAWIWNLGAPSSPSIRLESDFKDEDTSEVKTLHKDDVLDAEFSPDGRLVVTAGYDHNVGLWDASTGEFRTRLGHENPVRLARFSPDSSRVLTASGSEARVWDVRTGGIVVPPLGHRGPVLHAAFSDDGRRIATSGTDQSTRIWNAKTGALSTPLLTHNGQVNLAAFSPDGRFVVTASADRTARLWDLASGLAPIRTILHSSNLIQARLDPDGARVVSIGRNGACKVWELETGRQVGKEIRRGPVATDVAIGPGGEFVATAGTDGLVEVWRSRDAGHAAPPVRFPTAVGLCAFSPDGSRLLAVAGDEARIWDWRKGGPAIVLRHAPGVEIHHAEFSPDGSLVVTAGDDRSARVWRASDGKASAGPFSHAGPVTFAAFGPEGSGLLVTASIDRTAKVWPLGGTKPLATLAHNDPVVHAAFSPDGERIVTSSADRTARVWASRTGEAVAPFLEHDEPVQKAIFSPDGRLVATGSGGRATGDLGAARVWDAATGDPVSLPMRHGDGVHAIAFAADGRRLVTAGGRDSTARVWSLDPASESTAELAEIAEVFSAARIDRLGGQILIPPEELAATHSRLAARYPSIFSASAEDLNAWSIAEADALEAARRWRPAVASLDVLVASDPDNETLLARRANALASLGEFDRALADYDRAVDLGAEDDLLLSNWAVLTVRAGRLARYREVCEQQIRRYGDTRNEQRGNNLADMCTIAPTALKDPGVPVSMVERLVALDPKSGIFLNTLGAALYRAGRFSDSIRRLEAAERADKSPWNWIFLAMACKRDGRDDDAARWLRRFDEDPETRAARSTIGGRDWENQIRFELFRREAESLFKGRPS